MSKLQSINPSNYQILGEVDVLSPEDVKNKVEFARKAKEQWKNFSISRRINFLQKAIEELKSRKSEFILLESREMGMPINEAAMDFDAALEYANWYFDNAEKYLSPEITFENDKEIHQVFYEPIGICAVIIPWNFPLANFIWGAFQSLIVGNVIVLKHSEEVPLCGKFIEDIFSKYLPKGVLNEVYGDGEIGKFLVEQDISMIAFTGSAKVGKYLYEIAGKKFIKATMELGGSAPGIIFDDADIDLAVENICNLRLLNAGQCCDGLKRLLVQESIFDEVVHKISAVFSAKRVGNAEEKNTEMGPLVSRKQLDLLASQVDDAKTKGAKIVTGGNSLEEKFGGAFFEPTVLTNITNEMRVWNEEVFGPVLPIVKFKTEEDAVRLANETIYGLGAYIFTENKEKSERVANLIEAGMVGINGTNYIVPCNPFGGYKNSGFGREHGKYGFHEVTQVKVVAKNK